MDELVGELARKMIDQLGLTGVDPDEITSETAFFAGGLGLDSIDLLEMVFLLDREYGVLIDSRELGEKVFINFGTLARYVAEKRRPAVSGGPGLTRP